MTLRYRRNLKEFIRAPREKEHPGYGGLLRSDDEFFVEHEDLHPVAE